MKKPKAILIAPNNREIIQCVMKSACQYFELEDEALIKNKATARVRHLCFYIIHKNAMGVCDKTIGYYFKRGRTAVRYGIDLMDSHKNTYRQTLEDLNGIMAIANTFEKKYVWHLQPISSVR